MVRRMVFLSIRMPLSTWRLRREVEPSRAQPRLPSTAELSGTVRRPPGLRPPVRSGKAFCISQSQCPAYLSRQHSQRHFWGAVSFRAIQSLMFPLAPRLRNLAPFADFRARSSTSDVCPNSISNKLWRKLGLHHLPLLVPRRRNSLASTRRPADVLKE
jgi:hypothetical protein